MVRGPKGVPRFLARAELLFKYPESEATDDSLQSQNAERVSDNIDEVKSRRNLHQDIEFYIGDNVLEVSSPASIQPKTVREISKAISTESDIVHPREAVANIRGIVADRKFLNTNIKLKFGLNTIDASNNYKALTTDGRSTVLETDIQDKIRSGVYTDLSRVDVKIGPSYTYVLPDVINIKYSDLENLIAISKDVFDEYGLEYPMITITAEEIGVL